MNSVIGCQFLLMPLFHGDELLNFFDSERIAFDRFENFHDFTGIVMRILLTTVKFCNSFNLTI